MWARFSSAQSCIFIFVVLNIPPFAGVYPAAFCGSDSGSLAVSNPRKARPDQGGGGRKNITRIEAMKGTPRPRKKNVTRAPALLGEGEGAKKRATAKQSSFRYGATQRQVLAWVTKQRQPHEIAAGIVSSAKCKDRDRAKRRVTAFAIHRTRGDSTRKVANENRHQAQTIHRTTWDSGRRPSSENRYGNQRELHMREASVALNLDATSRCRRGDIITLIFHAKLTKIPHQFSS